jgi:hypothetical protein
VERQDIVRQVESSRVYYIYYIVETISIVIRGLSRKIGHSRRQKRRLVPPIRKPTLR